GMNGKDKERPNNSSAGDC
ncbi:hypothetical protein A3Q56_08739, partial [Intoshia linei]